MNQNIKILHTEWSDGWGGQEIRIINEAKALKELGVKVAIACKKESKILQKAKEAEIETFICNFSGIFDIKTILRLIKIIKKNGFNIINSHSGKDTWVAGFAAKISGIKFIRTRHLSNKINPSRLNFINEIADFIFTTGNCVKEDMVKFNRIDPKKIKSIPTGIDEEIFNPNSYDKISSKDEIGLEKDKFYIGNLAVLRSFKRHDIFLNIALKIHKIFPEIKFVIAGDGPQRNSIEEFITINKMNEYVKLLGHVDEPAKFLSSIDIFLLCSDSKEGVPQSLIQALLMKTPSISTNIGSIKDLYENENFIMKDFDENILYEELKNLITSKEKLKKLSTNPQIKIHKNFTKKVMAKNIFEIYNKLLKGNR